MTAADLIAKFTVALDEKWGYIYGIKHQKWSQAKQDAYVKAYSGDPDRQLSCEKGGKWIGHWVTDCSGLFAWSFEQLGGKIAHGSNSIWNSYCKQKGTIKNGRKSGGGEILPGTAVFTSSDGKHNHIGLYIGNGKVIEAEGTIHGVITSALTKSKWTHWGELKGVDYSAEEKPQPAKDEKPTLRKGSRGEYVTLAQTELINAGYDCGSKGADGIFGNDTEAAVKRFQKDWGLEADGVIGKRTWDQLAAAPSRRLYTVIIPHLMIEQTEKLKAEYPGAQMTPES